MEINKLILHILDTQKNIFVPSECEINKLNEDIVPLVESKLNRIFKSSNKKQAHFQNSPVEKIIFDYKTNVIDFVTCSQKIAHYLFEEKRKYNIFHSSDFIFAEVKHEDIRYLVGMDNAHFARLTHKTNTLEDKIQNDIIFENSLFSSNLTKEDRIFIVEYSNSSLQLIENPYVFQTNKIYVLQEILMCSAKPSYTETLKAMTLAVESLTQKHELDDTKTLPALKAAIKNAITLDKVIEPEEIIEDVFEDQNIQEEFKEEIKKMGIQSLEVENIKPNKQLSYQKIKTDNGIEITLPVDYMHQKDMVEFIHESNGKISIQIKNISSLITKH